MDELQNDEVELNTTVEVTTEVEDHESGAELATDNGAAHEEKPSVDEEAAKQDAINKAINKKHFEKKQLERELAEAKAKNAEYEKAQRELTEARVTEIPAMPDHFDDDFDVKMKARDEAIINKANFDNQNQVYLKQQQEQAQQAEQAKVLKIQESMQSYSSKATEFGISQEELNVAGNTVAQYGLSDDLVIHILGDADGPLITKHLAANPVEGFELATLSPYAQALKIEAMRGQLKPLKPRTSKTPAPSEPLNGSGATPSPYKYSDGATFE